MMETPFLEVPFRAACSEGKGAHLEVPSCPAGVEDHLGALGDALREVDPSP